MSTFYSLFDLCYGERVALRATRFVSKKSMSFTFVGWCKLCEKEHTVARRAPAGSFKTNTSADPRWDCYIRGTDVRLKMPYSMSRNGDEFTIGAVRFKMIGNGMHCEALDPIPASWFVDLSLDVIESVDELETVDDLL